MSKKNILVIYNSTKGFPEYEKSISDQSLELLRREISSEGFTLALLEVFDDLESLLAPYSPKDWVVVNWCEQLGDISNSYHLIPPVLEKLSFVYTGAGTHCLINTQNKASARDMLLSANASIPESRVFSSINDDPEGWNIFPCIVKPSMEHCSVGITKDSVVDDSEQLAGRIKYVIDEIRSPALVEQFIDGVEYNVPIVGNGKEAEIYPISSLEYSYFTDYHQRLCTYDAKWTPGTDEFTKIDIYCPPRALYGSLEKRIREQALLAYNVCYCRDYARIDIRVMNNIPYVLDVNSNPDITYDGGFYRSCKAKGLSYGQMFLKLCEVAQRRFEY